MAKKLFVPLNSDAFYWFKDKGKQFELRAYKGQWTEKNVFKGKPVELRRGYNTADKIKGVVGKVVIGNLNHILSIINYKKIIPVVNSKKEATAIIGKLLKNSRKFTAFEIKRK